MKQTIETKKCYICGEESEQSICTFDMKNTYLDNLPKKDTLEFIASRFEFCPTCGYVADDISRDLSKEEHICVISTKNKQAYKDLMEKTNDETLKKLWLEEMNDERYSFFGGIKFYLASYYELSGDELRYKKYLMEHIKSLEKLLTMKRAKSGKMLQEVFLGNAISEYYMLTECLRRAGNFDQALTHIEKYKKFKYSKDNKHYKAKFEMQEKLCKKKIAARK